MPTLYVTDPQTHVHLEQNHLALDREDAPARSPRRRIPLGQLNRLVVVGAARIGLPLVRAAMENEIPITLLSRSGRYQGGFAPYHERDTTLHVRQVRRMDDRGWCLGQARSLVEAKLRNSRRVLQRVATTRDPGSGENVPLSDGFRRRLRALEQANSLDEIRGVEGSAAALYFSHLPCRLPEGFRFEGRSRRPPRDPFNALISLGYALLLQEMRGLLLGAGLDPGIGVLHGLAYGRPALALDHVEPYRAPVADTLAFRLIGLGILKPEDFQDDPDDGVRLAPDALRRYFEEYETRMDRPFRREPDGPARSMREWMRLQVDSFRQSLQQGTPCEWFLMP